MNKTPRIKKSVIDDVLKSGSYHIFYKNKHLKELSTPMPKKIKSLIEKHVNPPKTEKKVFLIRLEYDSRKKNNNLIMTISQKIIAPNLNFSIDSNGYILSVSYSNEELNKYGFKIEHIIKILNGMKNKQISLKKNITSISDILG